MFISSPTCSRDGARHEFGVRPKAQLPSMHQSEIKATELRRFCHGVLDLRPTDARVQRAIALARAKSVAPWSRPTWFNEWSRARDIGANWGRPEPIGGPSADGGGVDPSFQSARHPHLAERSLISSHPSCLAPAIRQSRGKICKNRRVRSVAWVPLAVLALLLLTDAPWGGAMASHVQQTPTWTLLNATGPANRSSYGLAYAAPRFGTPYALLFGGRSGNKLLSDTWEFYGGEWHNLSLAIHPPATRYGTLAWDASDNYTVLFGGSNWTAYMNDTWIFSGGQWTKLHPLTSPPARRSAGMTFDAADGYIVLWGGHVGSPAYQPGYVMLNDTWTFHAGVWTNVTGKISPPPAAEPSLTYDADARAVILFGGYNQSGVHGYRGLNDTWEFRAGRWTNLSLSHSPWARDGAAVAYDPRLGGVVVAGGQDEGVAGHWLMNDTWLLTGNSTDGWVWAELYPKESFPPMDSAMAVFDARMGGMLLFGGVGSAPGAPMHWLGATWELH